MAAIIYNSVFSPSGALRFGMSETLELKKFLYVDAKGFGYLFYIL